MKTNNKNKLFVITGPSASGKTTAARQVMNNEVISFTSRAPRAGEVEGVDYKFMTRDEVEQYRLDGKLVEYVEYDGNAYGLDRDEIEGKLAKGDAFVIVDFYGFQQLREMYENIVSVFVYVPFEQAEARLKARGDSEASIEKRMSTFKDELKNRVEYDYVLKNSDGHLNSTVEILKTIVRTEGTK